MERFRIGETWCHTIDLKTPAKAFEGSLRLHDHGEDGWPDGCPKLHIMEKQREGKDVVDKSNRDNCTLERTVEQIIKSWTRNSRSVSTGLKTRRTGLLLSGPKFSEDRTFCMCFENQGPRVWRRGEARNPRCLRRSVKFSQSVMVWGARSSAGVGPLCFQEVWEHLVLPAADQL